MTGDGQETGAVALGQAARAFDLCCAEGHEPVLLNCDGFIRPRCGPVGRTEDAVASCKATCKATADPFYEGGVDGFGERWAVDGTLGRPLPARFARGMTTVAVKR